MTGVKSPLIRSFKSDDFSMLYAIYVLFSLSFHVALLVFIQSFLGLVFHVALI